MNSRHKQQLLQMTTERAESELNKRCDENKSLGWELQQKTIEYDSQIAVAVDVFALLTQQKVLSRWKPK